MLGMVEGGRSCWGWLREGGHEVVLSLCSTAFRNRG